MSMLECEFPRPYIKPELVIVLPHLVWQWANEMDRAIDIFKVYMYFEDAREKPLALQSSFPFYDVMTQCLNVQREIFVLYS